MRERRGNESGGGRERKINEKTGYKATETDSCMAEAPGSTPSSAQIERLGPGASSIIIFRLLQDSFSHPVHKFPVHPFHKSAS